MEWRCFKDQRIMAEADLQLEDLEDHHHFTQRGLKCVDCGLSFLMMDWYCFKDKVKMVDGDVQLGYGTNAENRRTSTQKGIKCPVCGTSFLLEKFVVGRLATAEKMIEGK
jgi:hypothetical protein